MEKEYLIISNCLKSMKEEYKIIPSKFLKRKIELAELKLKAIDASIPSTTIGNGNYIKSV